VKDLVPRNRRYFSIQYASSGSVRSFWRIYIPSFVRLSLNSIVRLLSGQRFKCHDRLGPWLQLGHLSSRMSWILDAGKIASGRADSYALLRQPKLIHTRFRPQHPVQSSPVNLVELFPRPTETSFVHTPH
jgi:hypothetical protein